VSVKTSVTFPAGLLAELDRDRRDIAIINRVAERLNREAEDTLEYQQFTLNARRAD
jgi:hypothetical protein